MTTPEESPRNERPTKRYSSSASEWETYLARFEKPVAVALAAASAETGLSKNVLINNAVANLLGVETQTAEIVTPYQELIDRLGGTNEP